MVEGSETLFIDARVRSVVHSSESDRVNSFSMAEESKFTVVSPFLVSVYSI